MTNRMAVCGAFLLGPLLAAPNAARADAMATAKAESFLTIVSKPDDVTIEGFADIFLEDTLETGTGVATADAVAEIVGADPDDLGVDDGTHQDADASAMVTSPGFGVATALALTDGFLTLENTSTTETLTTELMLTFEVSADAVADPGELALALAEVTVFDFDTLDVFFSSFVLSFNEGLISDSGDFAFDITLDPGDSLVLWVLNDAQAVAIVPEPGTMALTVLGGLGIVGGALVRRRRRAAV